MLGSSVRSRLHRHGLLFSGSQFPAAQPVGHQECSVERCLAVFPSRTYQTLTKEDVHEPAEHLPGPFRVFLAPYLHFQIDLFLKQPDIVWELFLQPYPPPLPACRGLTAGISTFPSIPENSEQDQCRRTRNS